MDAFLTVSLTTSPSAYFYKQLTPGSSAKTPQIQPLQHNALMLILVLCSFSPHPTLENPFKAALKEVGYKYYTIKILYYCSSSVCYLFALRYAAQL